LIVCYSDGLIERRGELLTEGLDRLKHAGRSLLRLPLDDVCSHVVKALGVDQSREDDVAVLAVRFDSPVRTRFHWAFPAEAGELRKLRAAIRSWLEERQVDQSTQNALLIAVGEACANAVEHAYHDSPRGEVRVDIEQRPDRMLEATVQDFGRFRPPAKQDPDRGHGTRIIGELTADFSSDSTSTGTTVRFRLPVADLRVSA
jgi:anti-sigma regulatory factor (Ser/Thr protein kinase)